MPTKKRPRKGSWVVTIKVIRTEQIVCDNCTQQEAQNDPWTHHDGVNPIDQEMTDWDVQSVHEND